jgi:hypothetical protein
MNSSLVKTGVDILTKFLEIINKATNAFNGLGGSITKIVGIVAVFNLGKKLYEKFVDPISGLFLDKIPELALESGKRAGEAFAKGVQNANMPKNNTTQNTENL